MQDDPVAFQQESPEFFWTKMNILFSSEGYDHKEVKALILRD
jgi:hypothetical protein